MINDEKDYYGENPACKQTNISFGINGEDVDPSSITTLLGIQPTKAFAKGDEFNSRSGSHKRGFGIWTLSSKGIIDSTSPEAHAKYLLQKLEPRAKEILNLSNEKSSRTYISFWWEAKDGHGGFTLSSPILLRLSELCNDFDFYFL